MTVQNKYMLPIKFMSLSQNYFLRKETYTYLPSEIFFSLDSELLFINLYPSGEKQKYLTITQILKLHFCFKSYFNFYQKEKVS